MCTRRRFERTGGSFRRNSRTAEGLPFLASSFIARRYPARILIFYCVGDRQFGLASAPTVPLSCTPCVPQ
jgi:hypothetical protein